jgi:hypothetical protein
MRAAFGGEGARDARDVTRGDFIKCADARSGIELGHLFDLH